MKYFLVIVAFLIGTALLMWAASAQAMGMCSTRVEMVAGLQGSRYGEAAIGKGLSMNGNIVIELFVGKETFTILASMPGGERSCIVAAGKTWVAETPEIHGDDL